MINLINHHYNYAKAENNYARREKKEKGIHSVSLSISRRVVRPLRAGCIFKYFKCMNTSFYLAFRKESDT